jgi:hypothetical protein
METIALLLCDYYKLVHNNKARILSLKEYMLGKSKVIDEIEREIPE